MYQKLKSILTENIFLKLFSILASICLWIVVMNINNPVEIKTFSFGINFINEDILTQNNIAILNMDELLNQKVEVKISGTRPTLLEITNLLEQKSANVTVDLAPLSAYTIDPDTSYIPVNLVPNIPSIAYPNNAYEVVSYSPANIGVVADNIIAVPRKITVEILNEVPNNYVYFTPSISSSNIQVVGPKSIVNSIYKIVAPVDIKDQTSSISMNVAPVAYDENGKVIEGLTFNLSTVLVEVPISKQGSISINTPSITGNVASGYLIKDIIVSPKFIEVTGSSANISSLGSINLQSIDVSSLTQTKTFTQDISYLLEQNKLSSKNNIEKVTITIQLEEIAKKTITLEQSNIDILGNLETSSVKILSEDIFFIIQGEKEFLDMVTLDSLSPFINITSLENGESLIPLNITLPTGITLVEKPLILVDLTLLDTQSDNSTTDDLELDENGDELEDNFLDDDDLIDGDLIDGDLIDDDLIDSDLIDDDDLNQENLSDIITIETITEDISLEEIPTTQQPPTTLRQTTTTRQTTTEESTQESTQESTETTTQESTQESTVIDLNILSTEESSQELMSINEIITISTTNDTYSTSTTNALTSNQENMLPNDVLSLEEFMNEIINGGNISVDGNDDGDVDVDDDVNN